MKRINKRQKGWTLIQLATAVTIGTLIFAISLPVISKVVNNIKEDAVIATLWALLEAQKSYRDAQTPTTYANNIATLIQQGYITGLQGSPPTKYGIEFSIPAVTPNTFTIEAKNPRNGSGVNINQNGNVNFFTGGEEGGGGGGDFDWRRRSFVHDLLQGR